MADEIIQSLALTPLPPLMPWRRWTAPWAASSPGWPPWARRWRRGTPRPPRRCRSSRTLPPGPRRQPPRCRSCRRPSARSRQRCFGPIRWGGAGGARRTGSADHSGPSAEGHAADRQDADRGGRQGGGQVHRVVGDHEPRRDDAGHRPRARRHPRCDARGVRLQFAVYDPRRGDSVDCAGRRQQPGFALAAFGRVVPAVQHPLGTSRRGPVSGDLEPVHQHGAADRGADGGLQAVQSGGDGRQPGGEPDRRHDERLPHAVQPGRGGGGEVLCHDPGRPRAGRGTGLGARPRDGRVVGAGRESGRAKRHDGHADHFRREAGRGRHRAALGDDGPYQAVAGLAEGTAPVGLRVRPADDRGSGARRGAAQAPRRAPTRTWRPSPS